MRLRTKLLVLVTFAAVARATTPAAARDPWQQILTSVGLTPDLTVLRSDSPVDSTWRQRVESGALAILEGESETARSIGFKMTPRKVRITSITDVHNSKLPIVWETPAEVFATELPAGAKAFARERWTGAPVLAGLKIGRGAVLWCAVAPGSRGYERFPYALQALADLGFASPYRAKDLWAFFDSSYRTRVDLDYFAERWRKAGIAAIHVASWHFNEPDPERDDYLRRLIEACHRRAILVYAWLELPHVSEKFWTDHPQWREKTALLQDAHLDWRKLMNLQNRDCFGAVVRETRDLLNRFDWDGVNLAELYFESLEGAGNLARFTPMNDDVRRMYSAERGSDPVDILRSRDPERLKAFLSWRAELARKMQHEWMAELESLRKDQKPHLDIVLTHVDDRFDSRMRDLIGADAARLLPLLDTRDFSFLIEDPATIWHLGPERYEQIAARYAPLTNRKDRLAIDINIVERYQDVYPTKQQTGTELFQLVHTASGVFSRVALYFENSILPPDLELLPAASAVVTREASGAVSSGKQFGIIAGQAAVDGAPWPVTDGTVTWLPAGTHTITPGTAIPLRLTDLNGDLKSARSTAMGMEFRYASSARAIAVFDHPVSVAVDGTPLAPVDGGPVLLPRGSHTVIATLK